MVSGDFSYPTYGGIAAHVYELSKALVNLGHTVHIIKPSYGNYPDLVETIDGIIIHWIFVPKRVTGLSFIHLIAKSSKYINRIAKAESINIIHWHELKYGSLSTKFAGTRQIPRIFTNHSSTYLYLCEKKIGLQILKLLLSHADAIISPSEELKSKTLLAWNNNYNFYIPNGVDINKFNPDIPVDSLLKGRYGIEPNNLTVLCPRRLVLKNGIKYLIESVSYVAEKVPNVKFLIVGDGPERDNILKIISDKGIENFVVMAGGVTNDKMPSIYALADIVVLPSLKEATSIAGLEAMACGKPLIGTNVGGIPAIIEDGKVGLLVPPMNSVELGKEITCLSLDKELRTSMGTKAREKVEKEFYWKIIAEKTLYVYESMIALLNSK